MFGFVAHVSSFRTIDDHEEFHENVPIMETNAQNNFGYVYGCGIFEMIYL